MRSFIPAVVAFSAFDTARAVRFHKFAALLNEGIAFADYPGYSTISFSLWAQSASSVLLPILDDAKETPMTILAPSTTAFADFIAGKGGNVTDLGTLVVGPWQQFWTGLYPYFYVKEAFSPLNATAETTVLDTQLRSSLGDWPLRLGFRNDPAFVTPPPDPASTDNTTLPAYNGTLVNTPYGSANVTLPDLPVVPIAPLVGVQVVNYVPTLPQSLSKTMTVLNITSFGDAVRRVPSLVQKETQADYTLFVPPEADIAAALTTLSDSALAAYFDAHTLPQRLVLPLTASDYTTAAGAALSVSIDGVSIVTDGRAGPVVGVPDAGRDILLDGGILQMLDATLVPVQSLATRRVEL